MKKRLVLLCDGTWNSLHNRDHDVQCLTNVGKLKPTVLPCAPDGAVQMLCYNPGVGTSRFDHLLGGLFGWHISRHILEVYTYIVLNYAPGDEIFLFGFSRGAYTARCVAGLICTSGILKRVEVDRAADAYTLYRKEDDPQSARAKTFRSAYAHALQPITFIGVWDTVGALGIPVLFPWPRIGKGKAQFHNLTLSPLVEHAYQAVAIDERRRPFRPALWTQHAAAPANQIMEQIWFAGVHKNVGGGYLDTGLSDIALQWMLDRAEACGLGVDRCRLQPSLLANPCGALQNSRTVPYTLLPPLKRRIPITAEARSQENGALHATVLTRRDANLHPRYRPSNVESYLKRLHQRRRVKWWYW